MKKFATLTVAASVVFVIFVSLLFLHGERGSSGLGGRIAFVSDASGDHEVWVINSDGSGRRRLTGDETPPNTGPLDWSPDGRLIVFTAYGGDGEDDIYVVDADRPGARRLTNTTGREVLPQFLPDGSILFWGKGGWIMDDDGSNLHHVDGSGPAGVLSPDGTVVLRTLGVQGRHYEESRVVTSDVNATYHRPLTEEFGYSDDPSWSADGELIAMGCANVEAYIVMLGAPEQEPTGVCVLRPDGTGLRRVVEAGDAPTLSPDGRWVAYFGVNGPSIVSTEGGEPRAFLTDCECLQVAELAWSPR